MHNTEETFILLKSKLAEELEKQGSSLEEFEELLKEGDWSLTDNPITNSVDRFVVTPAQKLIESGVNAIPELGTGSALLAGTTLGGLTYAANRHIQNKDKQVAGRQEEVDRYRQLTDQIKRDYGINH